MRPDLSWVQIRSGQKLGPTGMIVSLMYALATVGLLVVAFDATLFDKWAVVVLSCVAVAALAAILLTGIPLLWLPVGSLWIYAGVIEFVRGESVGERVGLGLIFLALSFGALAAHVAAARGEL